MPLKYKIDVLAALKKEGYTTYRLMLERVIGHSSIQKLKEGKILSPDGIEKLCKLLNCQPGDLICYESDEV